MKSLVVVPNRCVGCMRCELYCSFKFYQTHNPARARIHVIRSEPYIDTPIVCWHCGLCIDSCPQDAISRNKKTGAVEIDAEKCTKCGICISTCPIGMIKTDPVTKVAIKCDLCGGDPECVKRCPEKALLFIDADKAAYYKQRAFAKLYENSAQDPTLAQK